VFGDKALKRSLIYEMIKKGKEGKTVAGQRGFVTKMCVRNLASVTNITTEVESNRGVTERKLCSAHGMSSKTIHAMLQKDLNL
jgi:predicted DNA-binding transcriptional regulator AlpA